jgi:SAM-dependent methyltransferase
MNKISNQDLVSIPDYCSICGGKHFTKTTVIWDELAEDWELTPKQRSYIDDQQGLICSNCQSNLRSMTLASAIMTRLEKTDEFFMNFCSNNEIFRNLRILEINGAGNLTKYLAQLPKYLFSSFPECDMQNLSYEDNSCDIIIHSDTLEHIANSNKALQECRRVLRQNGFLAYTIPIIPERMTKDRDGLKPSFHGREDNNLGDYLVYREYGADFFAEIFEAGFRNINIHSIVYPASIAIIANKLA